MLSKPRRGRRSDPSWPLIVIAIVAGAIVTMAFSTGAARAAARAAARRVVNGLRERLDQQRGEQLRERLADAVSGRIPGTTTSGETPIDQADLTLTNEDAASDPGPPLIDAPSTEPTVPEEKADGIGTEPFDRRDIPEEQPLAAVAQELAAESNPDSVPADGTSVCPIDYPIKGNGRSRIYHLPGAFAYERTVPTICFRSADAAERAGFRAARH